MAVTVLSLPSQCGIDVRKLRSSGHIPLKDVMAQPHGRQLRVNSIEPVIYLTRWMTDRDLGEILNEPVSDKRILKEFLQHVISTEMYLGRWTAFYMPSLNHAMLCFEHVEQAVAAKLSLRR